MVRKVVLIAIYVIVVSALIIGIVLAFQRRAAAPANLATNGRASPGSSTAGASNQSAATAGRAAGSAGTSTAASGASSAPATTATGPTASGQPLANSGPGSVTLLFVVTAVIGCAGFSFYQRRRLTS